MTNLLRGTGAHRKVATLTDHHLQWCVYVSVLAAVDPQLDQPGQTVRPIRQTALLLVTITSDRPAAG